MKIELSSLLIKLFFAIAVVTTGITATSAAPPLNDSWSSAATLSGVPTTVNGLNVDATAQPCEQLHHIPGQTSLTPKASVWYKWQAPAAGSYTIRTVSANFDLVLSAHVMSYASCNGFSVPVPDPYVAGRAYNANLGPSEGGRISFRATQGSWIYISVDSATAATGFFTIAIEKTKFRYDAQLDPLDGGADLIANDTNQVWWMSRHNGFPGPTSSSAMAFGQTNDNRFVADFDGDAISDFAVVRNDNGKAVWWIADRSGALVKVIQFGLFSDRHIVGDWDGDGMADIAAIRYDAEYKKIWHILRSSGGYQAIQFGLHTDEAMVGDYDGDGRTDLAVMRITPNVDQTFTWYIQLSSTSVTIQRDFGSNYTSDSPAAADFDGDGKTDIAVYRAMTGTWYSLDSSSQVPLSQRPARVVQFGAPWDYPQAADYDGDRKTDYAVYRGGEWWILQSRTGQVKTYSFGLPSYLPMTDGGITYAFFH